MKDFQNNFFNLDGSTWQNLLLIYVAKILLAIVFLIIGFWIINRIMKTLYAFFDRRRLDSTLRSFLKNFISISLKILLVLVVLNFLGIKTTSVVALVGAAGLAIGLALQGTLANFAGGVMILLFKPFRIGDFIEAQGKKGIVTEIQMFTTILTADGGKKIIVPNSMLSNGIIENYGSKPA